MLTSRPPRSGTYPMILRFIPGTRRLLRLIALGALLLPGIACYGPGDTPRYDLVIRAGMIYDGNGGEPYQADIGIRGERITAIGDLGDDAGEIIDAEGLAVAPGFINMLSWATRSLLVDGRSQSNIRQGVTLEVFGEGTSPGPLSAAMRDRDESGHAGKWTTLGEYLDFMVDLGVSPNVASFVGATTVRIHEPCAGNGRA